MKEASSFVLVFGDSPLVRILDFFLDNQEFDYSMSDVARLSDISWATLHIYWKNILKLNLVVKTREIGRAKMYKLNKENPIVQKLIDLDFYISDNFIENEINKRHAKKQGIQH